MAVVLLPSQKQASVLVIGEAWRDALLYALLCWCGWQWVAFVGLWLVLRETRASRDPDVGVEPVGEKIVIVSRFDGGKK